MHTYIPAAPLHHARVLLVSLLTVFELVAGNQTTTADGIPSWSHDQSD